MVVTSLSQAEANRLLGLPKHRTDDQEWVYPDHRRRIAVPLVSADLRERFVLDLSSGRINLAKGTYQTRARGTVILARLDFGGAPHRNPDGEEIASPHLHLYREGYDDKRAYPLPSEAFGGRSDRWLMLDDFMRFCNVVEPPRIRRGLLA